jgi:hypothetical protein
MTMKKNDYLISCINLCENLLDKGYSNEIEAVLLQYWIFFRHHKILLEGYEVGQLGPVSDGVIKDFLEGEAMWEEVHGHALIPILIRDKVPQAVWKALQILEDGASRALLGSRLIYYTVSLKVPFRSLHRWMNPVGYFVVESEEARMRLGIESQIRLEMAEKELAKKEKMIEKPQVIQEEQKEKPRQPNPFASDSWGTLQGEPSDEPILPTNRVKIR